MPSLNNQTERRLGDGGCLLSRWPNSNYMSCYDGSLWDRVWSMRLRIDPCIKYLRPNGPLRFAACDEGIAATGQPPLQPCTMRVALCSTSDGSLATRAGLAAP